MQLTTQSAVSYTAFKISQVQLKISLVTTLVSEKGNILITSKSFAFLKFSLYSSSFNKTRFQQKIKECKMNFIKRMNNEYNSMFDLPSYVQNLLKTIHRTTVVKFKLRWNNYNSNDRKHQRLESCMQEHLFEHFNEEHQIFGRSFNHIHWQKNLMYSFQASINKISHFKYITNWPIQDFS